MFSLQQYCSKACWMCSFCLSLSPPLWSVCLPCGLFPSLALNPILPSPHSHSGLLNFLFIPMECALNRRLLLAIKFVERGQVFSDVISRTLTQSTSRAFLLHSPFHLATKRWHFNFHSRVTLYLFSGLFFSRLPYRSRLVLITGNDIIFLKGIVESMFFFEILLRQTRLWLIWAVVKKRQAGNMCLWM